MTRNRVLAAEVYFEAVEDFEVRDIEAGVTVILKGQLPHFKGEWAPTPPQFVTAVRRALDARLDEEARRRPKALSAPDIVRTPEERERAKAKVAALIANIEAQRTTEDAKLSRERDEFQQRAKARFLPDQSADAMKRRLGLPIRYEVGDPDNHDDAA